MTDPKEPSPTLAVTPHSLVTEQHVKAALKVDKGSDAHLTSWSVVDFTKNGDNYACFVTSVKVKFSLQQENSEVVYVAKINPCRNFKEIEAFNNVLFQKEAKFYLNLLPELNSALNQVGQRSLKLPKCFHGNLESGKEIIFLEDLRPREFKMFDRRRGLDVAHATLILEELARLHAASRLLQAKTPDHDLTNTYDFLLKDWLNYDENASTIMAPLLNMHLKNGIEMLEKIGGYKTCVSWLQGVMDKVVDIMEEQLGSSKYNVVCHGDCWNNNVLFRYNEEGEPVEVMLLDLQITRWASPATDLNYLLYTSLTGEVRKPNLEALLATYHTTFASIMKATGNDMIFTPTQLMTEFRDKNVIGTIFAIMIIPMVLLEPENVPDMNKEDVDIETLMNELRVTALENLDTNPLLRSRFLALFDEMMETGLIPSK